MGGDFSPSHRQLETAAGVPSLADPIFDPQPGYSFEGGQSENSQRPDLQRSCESQSSFFNPVNTNNTSAFPGAEEYSFPQSSDAFAHDVAMSGHPLDSSNMWDQMPSPSVGDFAGMFSNQDQIARDRSITVQHQFGQITPPDETIDKLLSAEQAKSDKSERARNAANQRHAKSKKARKDSRAVQGTPVSDDENDNEDKKERYREKNRLAAAKCRAKKKENIETIEDKHRNLSALNNVLKKQVQELRGELTGLRTHALDHQECNCQISRYNVNQAKRVAMGVDTASPPTFHGYQQRHASVPNVGGATPSPNMDVSQQRHHSYAAPSNYGFASVATPDDMSVMSAGPDGDPQFGQFMQNSGYGQQGGYPQ